MSKNIQIKENIQEEQGITFKTIYLTTDDYYSVDVNEYIQSGFCKIIINDKSITKTHYFKNFKETSIDNIIQEERIKQLQR